LPMKCSSFLQKSSPLSQGKSRNRGRLNHNLACRNEGFRACRTARGLSWREELVAGGALGDPELAA
jgi:hypothetical protein